MYLDAVAECVCELTQTLLLCIFWVIHTVTLIVRHT